VLEVRWGRAVQQHVAPNFLLLRQPTTLPLGRCGNCRSGSVSEASTLHRCGLTAHQVFVETAASDDVNSGSPRGSSSGVRGELAAAERLSESRHRRQVT
jgi:hypothetical protein